MKSWQFLMFGAVLLAVGCSSNNKGKIEGTKWSSLSATIKDKHIPKGVLTLEFGSDGSLTYRAGFQTFTGKYSLGAGDRVNLHLDQDIKGSKNHAQKVTIDGNQLVMMDSDGTKLTFEKVTEFKPQHPDPTDRPTDATGPPR